MDRSMVARFVAGAALLGVCASMLSIPSQAVAVRQEPQTEEPLKYEKDAWPFVKKYCIGCHNKDNAAGGLKFADDLKEADALKLRKEFTQSMRKVQRKQMPPKNAAQPGDKERARFLDWVKKSFPKKDEN